MAQHLARALAQGATPEDADINFELTSSDAGAPVLARATYSLRDLYEQRADVSDEAIPMIAMPALNTPHLGQTVAELRISLKGCKAVAACRDE